VKIFRYLFILLLLGCCIAHAAPLQWQQLAPGLEYTNIDSFVSMTGRGIQVFRFDLQHYQLQLAFNNKAERLQTVEQLVEANDAVIGINGGFFTPEMKPLGLRITDGQLHNPLHNASWLGVFFTQGKHAFIASPKDFHINKNIDFAVQSGPRLLVNGQILPLKPGMDNRSALGITQSGRIILLVTRNFPISTEGLAKIMQAPADQGGLNCVDALNLDGGSSSQLYARTNEFSLSVPSFAIVSDAILVIPKKQV
jgi:uncharacterized protein YigE (DUF2233 family)